MDGAPNGRQYVGGTEVSDTMRITILPDGRVRTETDRVSAAAHQSAEMFLHTVAKLCGGLTTRTRRVDVGTAIHVHDHSHTAGGHSHE